MEVFEPTVGLDWLIQHPTVAMKRLNSADSITHTPQNHHIFLSAMVAYVKHELQDDKLLKTWGALRVENSIPIVEHMVSGKPSERQKDKMMPWKDILKVRDGLPLSPVKLLLSLYTYINPIRADFFACPIYDKTPVSDNGNYVVLTESNPRLVLNDYKTKKTYGTIQIPFPKPLYDLITECVKTGICHGGYLFTNQYGEPFDRALFSGWCCRQLHKAFGKPMTLTAIRHNFTSAIDNNRPFKELNAIAESMAHSMITQKLYKWDQLSGKNEVVVPK